MPLLGREEFTLKTLPPDLSPNSKVFYCRITGEAFLSYDEYFERQFLYSSLLWTCSVTGKTGLTYAEALQSENESKSFLSSIPRVLQKVLLHLMSYMDNFSTSVTISLMFEYTNCRYFIGETIQVTTNKSKTKRVHGIIQDVIPPAISDESSATIAFGLDPSAYQYVVKLFNDQNSVEVFPASKIIRSKFMMTREKIRLFIKQHLAQKESRYATLSIKEESIEEFGIDRLQWENIFKGPVPNFKDDTILISSRSKRSDETAENNANEENSNEDSKIENDVPNKTPKKKSNLLSSQKMKLIKRKEKYNPDGKRKEKKSVKKEILKVQKAKLPRGKPGPKKKVPISESIAKESKKLEILKNLQREARKQFEEDLKNWTEKRDDLLCDDLNPLPQITPIDCDIENDLIGDVLMSIDFLNVFHEFISFNEDFPSFITFEYFCRILKDNNVDAKAGISDLLIALLNTVMMSSDSEKDVKINENHDDFDIFNNNADDEEAVNTQINNSNHWVTTYYSSKEQLSEVTLDAFTLSEVLRVYILKTRNNDGKRVKKICPEDMSLVIALTTHSVFELKPVDRIKIINLLLNDVVKIPTVRQKIETSMDEMFKLKNQIRHLNSAYSKWLRENPIRQRIRKKKPNQNGEGQVDQENEATPEEKEQYKTEKFEREQHMKDEIADLKAQIRKHSAFCRSRPLGTDRAHRKYWIFESIPGLFVENSMENPHSCFENPLPMPKPEWSIYLAKIKRRKKSKVPKEENPTETEVVPSENQKQSSVHCTGNPSTCLIHANQRFRWGFYTKQHLEELIESLNPRGFRESELKNAINIEKQTILSHYLEEFDPYPFNRNYTAPIEPEENCDGGQIRKSERLQIHDKSSKRRSKYDYNLQSSEVSAAESFSLNCQNQLLSFEDNVFNSCFSSFSTTDREEWYKGMNRSYCGDKIESLTMLTAKLWALAKSIRPFCLLPPLSVFPESPGASPTREKENIENNQMPRFRVPIISEKWLNVLRIPNGLNSGDLNDLETNYGITNHSQLLVNICILEKSLNWEMSALKTANKCGICRRKANEEMILCDLCNRGYHIYCVTPPISSVNEIDGDWYCQKCVPKPATNGQTTSSQVKKPASANNKQASVKLISKPSIQVKEETLVKKPAAVVANGEISDESESILDRCCRCKDPIYESQVICKTCGETFHTICVNLIRTPRSWQCLDCHQKERNDDPSYDQSGELRRSSRKRKPNHYLEFDPNNENYMNNIKARRIGNNSSPKDQSDDDTLNGQHRKPSRRLVSSNRPPNSVEID